MIDLLIKFALSFFVSGIVLFPTSDLISKSEHNTLNKKGQKIGKWYYFGKDIPSMNYPDETLVMEGEYAAGQKEGLWIRYHKDGTTPAFVGTYAKNRPQGAFKRYNTKGLLIESGNFSKGQYDGALAKFYDNGVVKYEGEFNLGLENGEIKYFDKNGQLELSYTVYNGVVSNKINQNEIQNNERLKQLDNKGTKVSTGNENNLAPLIANPIVKNGTFNPNGYNKVYNTKDDILQDGVFKDGRLFEGKLYQYDTDGIVFKVKVYKNGIYVSDGQI